MSIKEATTEELMAEIQRRELEKSSEIEKNRKEATIKISEFTKIAYENLKMAENLAREHKISFNWSPFYGGGGYFYGDDERGEGGWHSSSNC